MLVVVTRSLSPCDVPLKEESKKDLGRGAVRMEAGKDSGMRKSVKKGCCLIWSRVIRLVGSETSKRERRFLAVHDIGIYSLKVYWHSLIFL